MRRREKSSPKYTKSVHIFGLFSVDDVRTVCYYNNDLIIMSRVRSYVHDYGRKK